MTGLCPTCGHATELQHIGRTRIPVEFCARCNVTLGPLDDGQAQVMRLRAGRHLDDLAGDEYTHESLEGARAALAEKRPRAAYSEPVTEMTVQNTHNGERPMDSAAGDRPMDPS